MFFAFSIAFHSAFFFGLKIIIRTVIIEDPFIPWVDIVGVPIKLALDKIGFFRKYGKRAVHILEAVFWRFQQCLAILVAAQLAAGGEESDIDQICKDGVQIIFKFMPASDCAADLIHAKLGAEALEEKITDRKGTPFIHSDIGAL